MRRTLSTRSIIVLAAVSAALLAVAAPAGAATPSRSYSVSCPHTGYFGGYIKANPISIEPEYGVGLTLITGDGGYTPSTTQYIYYAVWAYQYNTHRWYRSPPKRVYEQYPNTPESWDASVGMWVPAASSASSADMVIGPSEVALRITPGSGRWAIKVQTYWAPPAAQQPSPSVQAAAPGGSTVLDSVNTTCTF